MLRSVGEAEGALRPGAVPAVGQAVLLSMCSAILAVPGRRGCCEDSGPSLFTPHKDFTEAIFAPCKTARRRRRCVVGAAGPVVLRPL